MLARCPRLCYLYRAFTNVGVRLFAEDNTRAIGDTEMEGLNRKTGLTDAQTRLRETLAPDRILLLDAARKKEALDALLDCLAQCAEISDADELKREIFRREEIMSTGIALGIGVPHVRLRSVKDIVAAVGVNRRAIPDYETLDGNPVRIIVMIAARQDQHEQYLRTLALITGKLTNTAIREALLGATNAASVYKILAG